MNNYTITLSGSEYGIQKREHEEQQTEQRTIFKKSNSPRHKNYQVQTEMKEPIKYIYTSLTRHYSAIKQQKKPKHSQDQKILVIL